MALLLSGPTAALQQVLLAKEQEHVREQQAQWADIKEQVAAYHERQIAIQAQQEALAHTSAQQEKQQVREAVLWIC